MSSKSCILLVEDEVNLARFIELELQCEGYETAIAHDGQVGLRLALELHPDVIILDWMLPKLSGVDICQQLRALGNQVPVIVLTARDEDRDRTVALAAGTSDFIVKPFQIDDVLSSIRSQLERVWLPEHQ